MKVLVLNGSPRRNGLVSQMLEHIAGNLPETCDVERIFVHDLTVRPCTGCMSCRSKLRCALPEDDAHRVAEAIRTADALVIGSPCYWGNMNGALKVLFDRSVHVMMGEKESGMPVALHKGQRAVLVATATRYIRSACCSTRPAGCSAPCARYSGGAVTASSAPRPKAAAARTAG